jgi:hypothetical protein
MDVVLAGGQLPVGPPDLSLRQPAAQGDGGRRRLLQRFARRRRTTSDPAGGSERKRVRDQVWRDRVEPQWPALQERFGRLQLSKDVLW